MAQNNSNSIENRLFGVVEQLRAKSSLAEGLSMFNASLVTGCLL